MNSGGSINPAREILQTSGASCVLCRGDAIYTYTGNGVAPLLEVLAAGLDVRGFSAADKIVGRAAALLLVLLGIKEIHAALISETAIDVLTRYQLEYTYAAKTAAIHNRAGTGLCPMEQAVSGVDEPAEALIAIREAVQQLKRRAEQANTQ
jgi:hypothetical protein